jgi:hypothetical protein
LSQRLHITSRIVPARPIEDIGHFSPLDPV